MLFMKFPDLEILVANDGSTDNTLQVMIDAFGLQPITRAHELILPHEKVRGVYGSPAYPQLIVVDKENGGCKADAVNAALNFSRNPLYCVVDADSLLEPESLLRCVRPFMEEPDRMVAVGGTIRVLNGCTVENGRITKVDLPNKFVTLVQTMEYIRAFLMARLAWSHWNMLSIISGAFGIFRRDLSMKVGGWSNDTIGEDYDFIVKLHRYLSEENIEYSMRYVPEPVCWTEAPEQLSVLRSQRTRWQRGALEVASKNKDMVFNPKYGRFGMLAMPNNFLVDVVGPIAEMIGYIALPFFYFLGILNEATCWLLLRSFSFLAPSSASAPWCWKSSNWRAPPVPATYCCWGWWHLSRILATASLTAGGASWAGGNFCARSKAGATCPAVAILRIKGNIWAKPT